MADPMANDFSSFYATPILTEVSGARADMAKHTADMRLDNADEHADIRLEGSEHTADVRREIASVDADIRRDNAKEASDTRTMIGTGFSDIRAGTVHEGSETRRDVNKGISDGRYENAVGQGKINDAIFVEGQTIRRDLAADTASLARDVAAQSEAVRRDASGHAAMLTRDVANLAASGIDATKTVGWGLADRIGAEGDRLAKGQSDYFIAAQNREFDIARDIAVIKTAAELNSIRAAADGIANADRLAQIVALEAARGQNATQLGHANLQRDILLSQAQTERAIVADGNVTRNLINTINNDELNRRLIERNAELVELAEAARDNERDRWDLRWGNIRDLSNAQFAGVSSQLNAFQSQLQETRQGLVNFGTMAGAAGQQSSTSNNVR